MAANAEVLKYYEQMESQDEVHRGKKVIAMKSKYSILITNYNTVDTIKQSLESILSQIDNNFEVIVVDNKSKDGSEKILKEFEKQGKIKVISIKCSRGRGEANSI